MSNLELIEVYYKLEEIIKYLEKEKESLVKND